MASKVQALAILLLSLLSLASFSLAVPVPPPRNGGGNQPPMMIPPPPSNGGATCPKDTLQLNVCADLLNLVKVTADIPPNDPSRRCCTLLEGLADLDATLCLCLTVKAYLLGLIDVQANISLALRVCNRNVPQNAIQCPR